MEHRTDTDSIAAESVRAACLDAAIQAHEDAGIRGLCADGRWEAALAAVRQLVLSSALETPAESPLPIQGSLSRQGNSRHVPPQEGGPDPFER